ncbi:hypothetical protein BpHYR1_038701 [Brachionus plicatilis]|uniref:Band 7 domain-containing protein n=1 Tax=Brachionus plicatilis TaxID=10195 RepID=A0A3M7SAB5_BRAPC|nr:hypothetical protein BpHYR1_038701 [Brachionus plicatilis]
MDEIPLNDLESSKSDNDENFEEELSAFYSDIDNFCTVQEAETKLDSASESDDENVNKPLIENPEEIIEPIVLEENEDYGPAEPEELGPLLKNEDPVIPEVLNNQEQNEQNNSVVSFHFPKLFIKKKVSIYFFLLGVGLLIYTVPKFFYGVQYDQIALAQSSITGKLHDKAFDSGLHFFYPCINKLNLHYRKFGSDPESLIKSVCLSEIQNIGQKFSIESYRERRLNVRDFFRKQLKKRLENDYFIKFHNLYVHQIKFTKVINNLNLVRMLNGLYKEKAEYEKLTNLTIAETARVVRSVKNAAKEIVENAKANADNLILKKAKYDLYTEMENTHLKYLNRSLSKLFFSTKTQNDTQKTLSFCYLSSLINNENIRIIKPGQEIPENGFSSRSDKLVGILSI